MLTIHAAENGFIIAEYQSDDDLPIERVAVSPEGLATIVKSWASRELDKRLTGPICMRG